jgi:hypothetical protein
MFLNILKLNYIMQFLKIISIITLILSNKKLIVFYLYNTTVEGIYIKIGDVVCYNIVH